MKLVWILLFSFAWSLSAEPLINLRSNPVLVRQGFDIEWSNSLLGKVSDDEWLSVSEGYGKDHSLSARFLNIPTVHERHFLSLDDSPDETFSYLFRFSLEPEHIEQKKISGILLATIGLRWQAYLNGKLVFDKLSDGKNNTRYNYIIPVSHQDLIPGENYLLFRVEGPRSNHLVGFYKGKEYLFGDFDYLINRATELVPFSIIVIYLLIGLFHLLLYLYKPSESYNGIYSIFSLLLAIFVASSSRFIFFFFEDSLIVYKIQSIGFFFLPLIGIYFFRTIFNQNFKSLEIVFIPFTITLGLGSLLFSSSWSFDIISCYKYIIPIVSLYVLFDIVGREFVKDIRTILDLERDSGNVRSNTSIFLEGISTNISGILFMGVLFFNIVILIDIIDMIFFYRGLFLTQYGYVVIVISITLTLTNRYLKMTEKNIELNEVLGHKVRELEVSDQKNKFLIDGTTDLLFVIGPKYEIRSMNQSARKYFGVKPESLVGKSFLDLLYTTPKDHHIVNHLVEENILSLSSAGSQTSFRARIRTSRMEEPMEFLFRLEAVDAGDHLEYIGKASSVLDENLTQYVIRESQVYQIDNYILMAEELSHRLVRVLKKKLPDYRVGAIRTGLREILVNSIEHGNLNISFEEKSQHLSKGDYLQLIASRQKDPVYKKRIVEVNYILTDSYVSYQITDGGNGFDYKELIKKAMANQSLGREHGRGIMLAENIFDIVEYQGKGNIVYLKVNF